MWHLDVRIQTYASKYFILWSHKLVHIVLIGHSVYKFYFPICSVLSYQYTSTDHMVLCGQSDMYSIVAHAQF